MGYITGSQKIETVCKGMCQTSVAVGEESRKTWAPKNKIMSQIMMNWYAVDEFIGYEKQSGELGCKYVLGYHMKWN